MELIVIVISWTLAYLLMGAVVTGLARRFNFISDYEVETTIIFWPVLIVVGFFTFIAILIAGD